MENTIKSGNPITYSLRVTKKGIDFYSELDEFSKKLINKAKIKYFGTVSAFQNYVEENKIEKTRKWEEYFLELLMLGVFWSVYSPFTSPRTKYYKVLFNGLYTIRRNKFLKPYADKIRGYLASFLLRKEQKSEPTFDAKNIVQLISWMDCTKEFIEEVKRLNNWAHFFKENPTIFNQVKNSISDFTDNFRQETKNVFSEYTSNVDRFLVEKHPEYERQENYFFTGRKEIEYHLNMVGASILNHVLKDEFQKTKNQVILLPTCMSSGKPCKAKMQGLEMICTHCTSTCNVSKISKELAEDGIRSVLIPHSSNFSKFLKLWANQKETGLVGVACVLNLIRGGYELIDLDIPSQCVFLDHCGCKKHWGRDKAIPTDLNLEQLKKILQIERSDSQIVIN